MNPSCDLHTWTILVGEVTAPHGIRGELQVRVLSDASGRFEPGSELCLAPRFGERRLVEVLATRSHKARLLALISGCQSRNEAEALRGATLTIHPSMRATLPEGQHYQDELIGVQVVTTAGEVIGPILEILETGSNDVYVTERALIPATREVVRSIDVAAKTMVIEPVPGLLD